MDEKETFTQKTLKSLRTHDGSERRTRKRKLSRIILFVDAIVVVLILIFFQTRTPEEHNRSATINYKDMQIRFSITNQKESGIYLYSITLKSTSKKQTVYTFDKSIAQLRIFHKNNTVITKTIGNDLVRLNLEPGEIKPFVDTIEMGYFNEYAHKNIQAKAKQRKTLFSFDDNTVTFKAVLTLNTGENVSMETNFTHEVSQ